MVDITITLSPPLNGVQSEVGTFEWGDWYSIINLPPSSEGVISVGVTMSGLPAGMPIQVRIPSQTIGGVTYPETYSSTFPWDQTSFTESIIMVGDAPPGNGEPISFSLREAVAPLVVGAALILLLGRG